MNSLASDLKKQAADTAKQVATDTVAAQVKDLRTQMLGEMRSVAREEIGASVKDQVNTAVAAAVKEQFAAVPGLVATEVRRQTTIVTPRTDISPLITGGPR